LRTKQAGELHPNICVTERKNCSARVAADASSAPLAKRA